MRFQVPQFIDVEDKIVGPLTFKQFLYVAGGFGIGIIFFRFFGILGILLAIPFIALGLALAFYKMNGKPFIFTLEAALVYLLPGRLYLWRKDTGPTIKATTEGDEDLNSLLYIPKLSQDKLKNMTWNLDTQQSAGPGAAETMKAHIAEKEKNSAQEKDAK